MEKFSTNYSLENNESSTKPDELNELYTLLKDDSKCFEDVFNYLNNLKQDVNEEKVQKIIEFAKKYRALIQNKENAEFR